MNARQTWTALRRNPAAIAGLIVLLALIAVAFFGSRLAPYPPQQPDLNALFSAPTADHPFGTDQLGRDLLSRVIAGSGYSLRTALLATLAAAVIGIPLGLLGGYFGGWIGRAVDLFTDSMLAFPGIILALAVVTALGPGFTNAMLAVGISFSPVYARLVRGQVLTVKQMPYIEAGRLLGYSHWRILGLHIVPNILAPIVVLSSLGLSGAILVGTALSFLGLGAAPPTPEWGAIMFAGVPFLQTAPWVTIFPGLAITITVLAANLVGDGLRDALDPRVRNVTVTRIKT